jgi:hypothetical protein
MMTGISGDAPRLTVTLNQVDDLRLENRALFKTSEDRVAFLDAIKNAREQVAKGVLNPTLDIPRPVNAQSLGLVAGKLDSSAILVGSTLLDVMTILHEIGQEQRKVAKMSRAVSREAEVDKLQEAASKIRQGAMFALASGIASGVMTIGGGLMTGVGAAKGGYTTLKGIQSANAAKVDMSQTLKNLQSGQQQVGGSNLSSGNVGSGNVGSNVGGSSNIQIGSNRTPITNQVPSNQSGNNVPGTNQSGNVGSSGNVSSNQSSSNSGAPQTVSDTRTGQSQKQSLLANLRDKLLSSKASEAAIQSKSIEASSTLGNTQMEGWRAAGTIMNGMGQIAGSVLDSQSKMMDARRAELEAEAKMFGYQSQEADEVVQKMLELMRDVRQKLGEIEQAQSQVQSKIWS